MKTVARTPRALLIAAALLPALTSCLGNSPIPSSTTAATSAPTTQVTEAPTATSQPTRNPPPAPSATAAPTTTPTPAPMPGATYCGSAREILKQQHPAEYAAIEAAGPVRRCVQGPLPTGAKIAAVPYYNQCGLDVAGNSLCSSDGGAVSAKMALEYLTGEPQDIEKLFAAVNAASPTTTDYDELRNVAMWNVGTIKEGPTSSLSWADLNNRINRGAVVIMRTKDPLYNAELPCDGACPSSNQYFLVVGVTDHELVVNYPITTSDPKDSQNGRNLVISRDIAERVFYREGNNPDLTIMPRAENETSVLPKYTGKVTYCGEGRRLFAETHPKEFAASGAPGTGLETPACVKGAAPDDALVWTVPYYPQGPYDRRILSHGGAGLLDIIMTAFSFGISIPRGDGILDYMQIAETGAPLANVVDYAYERGMLRGVDERMSLEEIETEIKQGHLIIMTTYLDSYGMEKYCLSDCEKGMPHYLLIVGVAPESKAIVVQDTSEPQIGPWSNRDTFDGYNLVLSWDVVSEGIYADKDKGVQIIVGPQMR